MRLKPILESLLKEQDPQQLPVPGADPNQVPAAPPMDPAMPMDPAANEQDPNAPLDPDAVIELPNQNMTVSVVRSKKTLTFIPQFHDSLTNKVRTYVNTLKQNFRVLRTVNKGMNTFEMQFDPRENFDEVIAAVQELAALEREFNEKF